MSPSGLNPLQTCKQHSSSCKRPHEEEEEVVEVHDVDEEAGPSRPIKRQAQSSLTPYMPSAEKEAAVNKGLLCFIITSLEVDSIA
eukprot:1154174-Pelagomonas_calceolata.AAC.5